MAGENQLPSEEYTARDFIPVADNAEPVQETRTRAPEPVQREEAEKPKEPRVGGKFDDKRNSIIEKLKAQRKAEDDTPVIAMPEQMERDRVGPHISTRADRTRQPEEIQTAQNVKPEDIPAPVRHKLKVNGREVEVDDAQFTALAQKALASEDILEQAKVARIQAQQRLAEVERLMVNQSQTDRQQPAPANAPAEDTKPATDAELDEIIDRIQTGDLKEGAEALRKFGNQVLEKAKADLGDVDSRIAATIRQAQETARIQADTQKVLDAFSSENPDFSQSQRRLEVLFDSTVDVMRQNMYAIGVRPEVLQNFAATHNLAPQAAVGFAYRKLREEGHQLDDPSKVIRDAASKVREDFGMPAPRKEPAPAPQARDTTPFVAERVERKQAMSPQPRRANVAPAAEPQAEKSQEQSRLQAVRNMKAYRRGR